MTAVPRGQLQPPATGPAGEDLTWLADPTDRVHARRELPAQRNLQAIAFFEHLLADATVDPDQVETLRLLQ